jgi:hypothetical protein
MFWQLMDVYFDSMFINLYESLRKEKYVYTLIFIHICEAMHTALNDTVYLYPKMLVPDFPLLKHPDQRLDSF